MNKIGHFDRSIVTRRDTIGSQEEPSKRRLERIALYKAIIGYEHARILELGCGSGDVAYALVDHAERIVATDIDGEDIKLAQRRAEPVEGNRIQADVGAAARLFRKRVRLGDQHFDGGTSQSA